MSNHGWISLHRKIQDTPIYSDSHAVHLWVHLLLKANHQDKEFLFNGVMQSVKRGQLLTGRKALSSETGINESKIQRLLKTFEMCQMIEQQSSNKSRLISITNYDSHQASEQQVNNTRTTGEQQVNTNNNVNNDNKVKSTKADQVPYKKIAELYNEVCTNLPKVLKPENLNDKRKRAIKKFWNNHSDNQNSQFFADYFYLANQDQFFCGFNNNDAHSNWRADIEFLMRVDTYDKFMERQQHA